MTSLHPGGSSNWSTETSFACSPGWIAAGGIWGSGPSDVYVVAVAGAILHGT
jgi:hypothetical protein